MGALARWHAASSRFSNLLYCAQKSKASDNLWCTMPCHQRKATLTPCPRTWKPRNPSSTPTFISAWDSFFSTCMLRSSNWVRIKRRMTHLCLEPWSWVAEASGRHGSRSRHRKRSSTADNCNCNRPVCGLRTSSSRRFPERLSAYRQAAPEPVACTALGWVPAKGWLPERLSA